jgi:predicted metalloprotease
MSYLRGRVGMAAIAMVPFVAPDHPVRVTQRDVDASNQKVAAAYSALVDMWSKDFAQIGERFNAPRVVRYSGSVMTRCGVIQPNHAQYCSGANAIYYDEVFVAGMA